MKKINTLLIDDEISAINTLGGMLSSFFPQIKVVGTATSVEEALQKTAQLQPELVMLDVEMPPFGSGFDFLEKCPTRPSFGVIFVTAYPNYAIKAINNAQPWGYLVKPYSVNDLSVAIQKAEEKIREKEGQPSLHEEQGLIMHDARKGNVVIKIKDIVYCEADGTTTDIHYFKEGKMLRFTASRTLKDIEEQLPEWLFCRSHHSFVVNLSYVERYERTGRNGVIHLKNNAKAPISVGKMEDFEVQFLQFLNTNS